MNITLSVEEALKYEKELRDWHGRRSAVVIGAIVSNQTYLPQSVDRLIDAAKRTFELENPQPRLLPSL